MTAGLRARQKGHTMDSVLADTLKANLKNAATEEAMMDVLTRKIYRNAGSGNFGYGNDLKYPIPAE